MEAWNGTFEMVDSRLIVCDHKYQREEKEPHIADISARFDWRQFGVVCCSRRSDGVYVALDGQQRLGAIKILFPGGTKVPVVWFAYDRVDQEAADFGGMNERRKALQPIEKHRARVVANDPTALAIERAVNTAGFTIGHGDDGMESKTIGAVGAVYKLFNEFGEDGLLHILVILRDAWPNYRLAVSSLILNGIHDVAVEQNGGFERGRMTTALKRTDPTKILAKANEIKYLKGGTKRQAVRGSFKALAKV